MRIIDADALPVVTECCVDEAGFFAKFNVVHDEEIQKAPTISYKDLVPQGEWISDFCDYDPYCSVCKEFAISYEDHTSYSEHYYRTDFCPNCGARMVNV